MAEVHIEPPTPVDSVPRKNLVDSVQQLENGPDTPHEHLTPRNRSPHPSIDSRSEGPDLEWYDDRCHDEYEWVRLPKNRDFDIFLVPRHDPSKRDTANVPLILRKHDGTQVILWAKMDTGADENIINASTVRALFGDQTDIKRHPLTAKLEEYHLVGDNKIEITHSVNLDFQAGRSAKQFEKIRFMIMPDEAERSSKDGVPDVILGLPTLQEHSMVMIDLDYHVEADPELPVLAEKAEKEHGTIRTIGPIKKFPPAPPPRGR